MLELFWEHTPTRLTFGELNQVGDDAACKDECGNRVEHD
jgi:hypothetical protein